MHAPDKIYIEHEYTDNTTLPCGVNWENRTNDNDTCYVRKDALLEWANKEIERLKRGYKEKWLDAKIPYGSVLAMQNLIDKLNSI